MSKKALCQAPDISAHQGAINLSAVKAAGYNEIYLRAGYGKNNIDQRFQPNATECVRLGLSVMIYWFSYALNPEMAAKEAEYAVAQAKQYWKTCPIAYDLEYDTRRYAATKGVNIDKKLATDMAIAFLKVVKAAGYTPAIYFNRDYKRNYLNLQRIRTEVGEVKYWYALYSSKISDAELADVDVWQYTSKGRIPGISGNVDINKVYTNMFDKAVTVQVKPATANIYIKEFQHAANADGYKDNAGNALEEDGILGPKTKEVMRKVFLKAKAKLFVGSTGALVKWWQRRLNEVMNRDLDEDGRYGNQSRKFTIDFQKKSGLVADGVVGYNTLYTMLFK